MIFNIDSPDSVQFFVKQITQDWFDVNNLYSEIKEESLTSNSEFWKIPGKFINIISKHLGYSSNEFLEIFGKKCLTHNAEIMGFHCTRHSDKNAFLKKGILPLSDETIKFSEEQHSENAEQFLTYRTNKSPGPFLFLSYLSALDTNNTFCKKGAEILLACRGRQTGNIRSESQPLIIHCTIPFSLLPNKDFYVFCILVAYFNFLDPEDNTRNLFDGYSIDLKGNSLDPKFILKIEQINENL